jgi:hypothetical protein
VIAHWCLPAPNHSHLAVFDRDLSCLLVFLAIAGGLACLCGQQGRWVLRRSAASIGRSTDAKGDVDIDLGKAAGAVGVGSKVSRLQAQLLLTADGSWSITNTGRASLAVNGQQVGAHVIACCLVNRGGGGASSQLHSQASSSAGAKAERHKWGASYHCLLHPGLGWCGDTHQVCDDTQTAWGLRASICSRGFSGTGQGV